MGDINYYNSIDFQERLSIAQKFQDHCIFHIREKLNITISVFLSKEYQWNIGESMQGFEFKYDMNFNKTNNLWIKIAQRNTADLEYKKSGIYQKDNCWLYCIGDYSVLYFFGKKFLQNLYKDNNFPIIESNARTTKGFLLCKENAEKYCTHKIETPEGCIINHERGAA